MAKLPMTRAIRVLRKAGVEFESFVYTYVSRGGASASAKALGVSEHVVIKTLVFEDTSRAAHIVLMHGDVQVSTKALARHLGTKTLRPCDPGVAQRHTGYQVGGTSPFGMQNELPIYVPPSVLELPWVWINGGKRGLLVRIEPAVVVALLRPFVVDVRAGS